MNFDGNGGKAELIVHPAQMGMKSKWYTCRVCKKAMVLLGPPEVPEEAWPKENEMLCPKCNEARAGYGDPQADFEKRCPDLFGPKT